jgi:hypothetical protein
MAFGRRWLDDPDLPLQHKANQDLAMALGEALKTHKNETACNTGTVCQNQLPTYCDRKCLLQFLKKIEVQDDAGFKDISNFCNIELAKRLVLRLDCITNLSKLTNPPSEKDKIRVRNIANSDKGK